MTETTDHRAPDVRVDGHPYADGWEQVMIPLALRTYVDSYDALPDEAFRFYPPHVKRYWESKVRAAGLPYPVPGGTYVDHKHPSTDAYVLGAYDAMGGTPVTRHLMAVALGFQSADQFEQVRDRLAARDLIDGGSKGRSARSLTVPDGEATDTADAS